MVKETPSKPICVKNSIESSISPQKNRDRAKSDYLEPLPLSTET
jgi:hypothetical protein